MNVSHVALTSGASPCDSVSLSALHTVCQDVHLTWRIGDAFRRETREKEKSAGEESAARKTAAFVMRRKKKGDEWLQCVVARADESKQ